MNSLVVCGAWRGGRKQLYESLVLAKSDLQCGPTSEVHNDALISGHIPQSNMCRAAISSWQNDLHAGEYMGVVVVVVSIAGEQMQKRRSVRAVKDFGLILVDMSALMK